MISQYVWLGIVIAVFVAGIGMGYGMFQQNVNLNYAMPDQQQMQYMMNDPQFMSQWNQQMTQNPQAMNQWMNFMIQNPQAGKWMIGPMVNNQQYMQSVIGPIMNDQHLRQNMYDLMLQHNQFMQGMMNYPQFKNQWLYPMMDSWNGTMDYGINHGMMDSGMMNNMMGTAIAGDNEILSTIQNIKKPLDESLSAYNSGNKNKASSLVTIAYLDNYEYIEGAISQKDNALKEKVELALRSDLRYMLENSDSPENVHAAFSSIKTDLDKIASLFN